MPRFINSPLILVIVGEEKTRFAVHKGVLIRDSNFFKHSLAPGTKELESRTVTVPGADWKIFSYFVNWAYLRATNTGFPKENFFYEDNELHPLTTWDLMQVWVLAGMLVMPVWQNHLMRQLSIHYQENPVSPGEMIAIFLHLEEDTKLWQFLIDQFASDLKNRGYYGGNSQDWETMILNTDLLSKAIDAARTWEVDETRGEEPCHQVEKYYVK